MFTWTSSPSQYLEASLPWTPFPCGNLGDKSWVFTGSECQATHLQTDLPLLLTHVLSVLCLGMAPGPPSGWHLQAREEGGLRGRGL